MSINGSSGSCHPRRDAELIPICNRLLTDLHVVRKMKWTYTKKQDNDANQINFCSRQRDYSFTVALCSFSKPCVLIVWGSTITKYATYRMLEILLVSF